MSHAAFPAHSGLIFAVPGASIHPPIPYFPQGIAAGFPSPADDYLQKKLDLHEHLIKHPAATFFAHVRGDSMRDANLSDGDQPHQRVYFSAHHHRENEGEAEYIAFTALAAQVLSRWTGRICSGLPSMA